MKSHLHLNIRIKAKDKLMKWDVVLNPVFFMYHNAFEVKVVEGPLSSSIFCCKISDFEYNWYAKLQPVCLNANTNYCWNCGFCTHHDIHGQN